ncbi:HNH endonuclease [Clostridium beijerinckii]|uniref:HNH endonuclease n=1 Tax=Clostridium beijerinckii TaxID=1520 RepID=UPI001361DFC1|nr:HNH endonuclease [Clostridium beijerinckii]MZK53479.1 hypothetical protein [Clostridium beijerinckii]MZK61617.1 hypothetical protein [Clostridium beijerinckii]MZK71842.1 hypothetical protein [Clostridium beijerinckii]MZK77246.1 hypothetical protein [Clostridium beijerinckii]MZK86325.1 hypothetical protein [Clostridium beijerinckii]
MEKKICNKCGQELSLEMFYKDKKAKDGYRNPCKVCVKKYYEENKEKYRENNKEYYKNNKEKLTERHKKYYEENKEYYANHRKQYYKENKEKESELMKKWRQNNLKKVARCSRKWARNNPEKTRIKNQRRVAKKKQLPSTLNEEQWINIKNYFNNRCAYCGKELHLEQEHFIPITKGGEYSSNNIIPACRSCNASKHDKDFFEWYPKYRYYSKKREKAILNFLQYSNNKQQLHMTINYK